MVSPSLISDISKLWLKFYFRVGGDGFCSGGSGFGGGNSVLEVVDLG